MNIKDYGISCHDGKSNEIKAGKDPVKPCNKKRTAIITGAASGIGRACIMRLAADGYNVVGCSRRAADHPAVISLGQSLDNLGAGWRYISADISDDEGRRQIVETAYDSFEGLDVLVNCAGIAPEKRADILELTPDSFNHVLGVNLHGTFFLTQYAAARMIADKGSDAFRAIINITSVSAATVSLNRAEYCISKAGLSMVSKLFAARLAEYKINVYELRPGIINTEMIAPVRERYEKLLSDGLAPLGRIGSPDDIANAVSALSSGALIYSTGEVINLDGGMHIQRL